jgi:urease accessory protein
LEGKLYLEYQYQQSQTKIINSYHLAPLKVQRPFYLEGEKTCHTIILNTAGGIVETDNLEQQIHLHPQAEVLITTASAGKIYRSQKTQSQQNINIKIDEGACLEFLPQENIIFSGANYLQNMRIELAAKAQYLGWEINRFGRTARGEKFLTGTWLSATEIWRAAEPLWIDRQGLWDPQNLYSSPNGLANKPVVGTLSWIGVPVSTEFITEIRNLGKTLVGETGVTQLTQGLICRYRGQATTEVKTWFKEIGSKLRLKYLNKSIYQFRTW